MARTNSHMFIVLERQRQSAVINAEAGIARGTISAGKHVGLL